MPRKKSYQFDYDEDYYDYDDYADDDDYDYGTEEYDKSSQVDKAVSKPGLWRCSICTYENDEGLSSCDICGVFRDSHGNAVNDGGDKLHCMSGNSGASIMAKSLFAQYPYGTPKEAIISDDLPSKEVNESYDKVPFQFSTPSPDDIVSAGKNSSRLSKADSVRPASTKASSTIVGKKGIVKYLPNNGVSDNSSTTLSKDNNLREGESSNINQKKENKSTSATDDDKAPQILASKLHDLKLDKNLVTRRKSNPQARYKPEKWMLADQEPGILRQLNLAIVGHVDSGKSTLSGRLLHLLGWISKKEMHKYEKEAKEMGKGSFAYAWAMDESTEERERGVTMTVAVAYFNTKKYHVVLLDSPGHKDFVPNMISGATQADAAVLVVDASIGSFEAGMDGNGFGQTREHAQLIRSFGVEQLIVAINKMDAVEYSRERYDSIKLQLSSFLRSCGFKESLVTWIPLSAMENQNLVTDATDVRLSTWYQGCCLLDAIDALQPPLREVSKPLLLPICDVIKSYSLGQVAACGKLETGAIQIGSKILVMPSGELAMVRSMERDSRSCSVARAGDNVAVGLQGVEAGHVMPGGVLCHPDFPVSVASRLEMKILVLDITTPILVGSQVEFHIHHAKESARVVQILSLIDQKTGKISKKAPRVLTAKQSALIEVALDGEVCVEEFSHCRALGRAFLRASGNTIAVGIVSKVFER